MGSCDLPGSTRLPAGASRGPPTVMLPTILRAVTTTSAIEKEPEAREDKPLKEVSRSQRWSEDSNPRPKSGSKAWFLDALLHHNSNCPELK